MSRLPEPWGTRIDRGKPLSFRFEGRRLQGLAGDSLASALAANGQWMLSRSFKYHRPRGVFSMAGAEANTLVQLPHEPNAAAEFVSLAEGLEARAQNVSPTLERDRGAWIGAFARFLPVGFYYRSFMGPTRSAFLRLWEPMIRRRAGLGVIDPRTPWRHYTSSHLHCDVLVVGGGLAGLSAAVAAARAGADVILCDEGPEVGGAALWQREGMADVAPLLAAARTLPNLRLLTGTLCNGWFEDNWLPLIRGDHLFRTRAREVILATGGIEQPAIFRNNDLPGIMTGGAAQRLMRLYAVCPGNRAVVLASTREGYRVALDLLDAGVEVAALADPRPGGSGGPLAAEVAARAVAILPETVAEARGTRHLQALRIGGQWIDADLLTVSVASAPAWQLPCQAGSRLSYDEAAARFTVTPPETLGLAGAVNGCTGAGAVMADGQRAAQAALSRLGLPTVPVPRPADPEAAFASFALPITADPKGQDFVDFDEDLQVRDLQNAVSEGYSELELVKRFSTVGMGPSQGRHSALATARIVAAATGRTVAETGVTTARPPVSAEPLGLLGGHFAVLERRTALHACHLAAGARMQTAGAWWRPTAYGDIAAEVALVRRGAGMLDVSTLGKLDIRGAEAGAFLDRLYTLSHGDQPVGRVRYCLMLNEMGSVIDDGVAWRMAEDRFFVTATTGAVARVYADMLFWNARWRMKVDVLNMTSAFAAINVTGPLARGVLDRAGCDFDLDPAALPHLHGREGRVAGVPVRALRVGFTGEVSIELHCPASRAVPLWQALLAAGARPYGLEASRILRLEKGHIIIGQDTDALTTPDELGMGWALSRRKPFYIGKRSVEMRRRLGLTRRLVGLTFPRGARDLPGESCLVLRDGAPAGHVTSVAQSPTLGHAIGLAFVPADTVAGGLVTVKCRNGVLVEGRVAGHAFYDPDGTRQAM